MGPTWLVAGASGQLGFDLMRLPRIDGRRLVGLDLPDLDITSPPSVAAALDKYRPDVVVNAAAYTAVDAAESDEATALRVNGLGPRVLAEACAERPGTRLVQISTDYVFAGDASSAYEEDAEPLPRTAYGRTKLAGEQAVQDALPDASYIVRTAWLYGEGGANFVRTMLALEAERDTLDVVDDQIGQPTWAHDLAAQIDALVSSDAPAGIYHGTNAGEVSWCGLAREVFRLAGADPSRVRPTTTGAFVRPAPRPAWSVLGHGRWADVGLAAMQPWQQALAEAMPALLAVEGRVTPPAVDGRSASPVMDADDGAESG
jgi:dTDP-4-dehydrorhamnose reductase